MTTHFSAVVLFTVGGGWLMSRLGFDLQLLERRGLRRDACPSCGRPFGERGCPRCR